jgi:succinate-semialdehyde dehydrogenase/glutarate-semialdehyde dehydrogenase
MAYKSVNLSNGKPGGTSTGIPDERVAKRPAWATHTYESWQTKTYEERARVVAKAAELMQEHLSTLLRLAPIEMEKPRNESRGICKERR